jgi:hypothetical protein
MDRKEELRQWIDLPANNLRTAEHIAENMRPDYFLFLILPLPHF